MQAVGNDIVDLQEALLTNKSHDQRFLNRVFTASEQSIILNSEKPEITLWLLWAAKETAYKLVSQLESPPIFSHKKFIVSFLNSELNVSYETHNFELSYKTTKNYIHTYGSLGIAKQNPEKTVVNVQKLDEMEEPNLASLNQKFTKEEQKSIQSIASARVRYDLKQHLAKQLKRPYETIEIIRKTIQGKSQPPYVLINQKKSLTSISLSHHGRYYAWAFTIRM